MAAGSTAELALPIAGLMSLLSFEDVADKLHHLREAAFALGCTPARAVPAGRVPCPAGDPASEDD